MIRNRRRKNSIPHYPPIDIQFMITYGSYINNSILWNIRYIKCFTEPGICHYIINLLTSHTLRFHFCTAYPLCRPISSKQPHTPICRITPCRPTIMLIGETDFPETSLPGRQRYSSINNIHRLSRVNTTAIPKISTICIKQIRELATRI